MTRQWCVPSHEGSVFMQRAAFRRANVKREPLGGQPSLLRLIFRGPFWAPLQIMPPNAQQRADGTPRNNMRLNSSRVHGCRPRQTSQCESQSTVAVAPSDSGSEHAVRVTSERSASRAKAASSRQGR